MVDGWLDGRVGSLKFAHRLEHGFRLLWVQMAGDETTILWTLTRR